MARPPCQLPVLSHQCAPMVKSQHTWHLSPLVSAPSACPPWAGTQTVTVVKVQRNLTGAKVRSGSGIPHEAKWFLNLVEIRFSSSEPVLLPLLISQSVTLWETKERWLTQGHSGGLRRGQASILLLLVAGLPALSLPKPGVTPFPPGTEQVVFLSAV